MNYWTVVSECDIGQHTCMLQSDRRGKEQQRAAGETEKNMDAEETRDNKLELEMFTYKN